VGGIGPGASQGTYPGKRPHSEEGTSDWAEEESGGHMPSPHKKARAQMANRRVLKAAGYTSRAPHKSSTKTPEAKNEKSKAAGPGAGRLVAPNAQGVYHQSLPGPSSRKELVGTTVQDQLPWVEGSEDATGHYTSDVVQQQQALSNCAMDGEDGHFRIPKRLNQRHRSLLDATLDDVARGTIQELKCRLCPEAGFSNWDNFKRHCDEMEAHPLKILFCGYCGDFFARKDTLVRHEENRPPECFSVTEAEAAVKRTETKKVHDAFQEKLEKCLGNSGEAWTPFSQIILAIFPDSSKKGSRQQCRTKAPKA